MTVAIAPIPAREVPDASLAEALAQALAGAGHGEGATLLARRPARRLSTWQAEVVRCRLAGGDEVELFCKHAPEGRLPGQGRRRGLAHEAAIYREVLSRAPLPSPRWYGSHADGRRFWLFLEQLDGACPAGESPDARAWPRAAAWIARLHAMSEGERGSDVRQPPGATGEHARGGSVRDGITRLGDALPCYDAAYHRGRVERAVEYSRPLHGDQPWLPLLRERAAELTAPLLEAPPVLVHGDLYPSNLLEAGGEVHPIDWESAALGAGEIDLAAMTDSWSVDVVATCVREYTRTRFGGAAPPGFERRLDAARAYLLARSLGERPEWTVSPSHRPLLDRLRACARRLGVLD